jgi:flavin-dependent dehydrogenase
MTGQKIHEPGRDIPITQNYDVLVCGGGVAGIAAALGAARRGADVCLIEKQYCLGGLATLGLICDFLPLCDGAGRQVIRGIAEEFFYKAAARGAEPLPECLVD